MITTNNIPRLVIDGYQLAEKERAEFDYINWDNVEQGNDSAEFFRYKGNLYHLQDAMRIDQENLPCGSELKGWQGYYGESYFSVVVFKYCPDFDHVIVAHITS